MARLKVRVGKNVVDWHPKNVITDMQSQTDPDHQVYLKKNYEQKSYSNMVTILMMRRTSGHGVIRSLLRLQSTSIQQVEVFIITVVLLMRHKSDLNLAIEDFDEAIRLDPQDAGAYSNLGLAYNTKGDYDRAIAELDTAIKTQFQGCYSPL